MEICSAWQRRDPDKKYAIIFQVCSFYYHLLLIFWGGVNLKECVYFLAFVLNMQKVATDATEPVGINYRIWFLRVWLSL